MHFGIAASSGKGANEHKVCFEKLAFQHWINTPASLKFEESLSRNLLNGKIVAFDNLQFADNAYLKTPEGDKDLEKLKHLLDQHPDLNLDIFAHVFRSKKGQSRLGLSVVRANEIKNALVKLGVDKNRIQAKGVGDKFPRNKRELAKGKQHDRIQFYLYRPFP